MCSVGVVEYRSIYPVFLSQIVTNVISKSVAESLSGNKVRYLNNICKRKQQ